MGCGGSSQANVAPVYDIGPLEGFEDKANVVRVDNDDATEINKQSPPSPSPSPPPPPSPFPSPSPDNQRSDEKRASRSRNTNGVETHERREGDGDTRTVMPSIVLDELESSVRSWSPRSSHEPEAGKKASAAFAEDSPSDPAPVAANNLGESIDIEAVTPDEKSVNEVHLPKYDELMSHSDVVISLTILWYCEDKGVDVIFDGDLCFHLLFSSGEQIRYSTG